MKERKKVTFLGQTFEITKELLDELKQRVNEKPEKKPKGPGESGGEKSPKKDLFAVLTKENFEEVEYFPDFKKRKIKINDTYPKLLNKKIKLHKHQKKKEFNGLVMPLIKVYLEFLWQTIWDLVKHFKPYPFYLL